LLPARDRPQEVAPSNRHVLLVEHGHSSKKCAHRADHEQSGIQCLPLLHGFIAGPNDARRLHAGQSYGRTSTQLDDCMFDHRADQDAQI
jgi:hypothetical protein